MNSLEELLGKDWDKGQLHNNYKSPKHQHMGEDAPEKFTVPFSDTLKPQDYPFSDVVPSVSNSSYNPEVANKINSTQYLIKNMTLFLEIAAYFQRVDAVSAKMGDLTVAELARLSGYNRTVVSAVLNKRHLNRYDVLEALEGVV